MSSFRCSWRLDQLDKNDRDDYLRVIISSLTMYLYLRGVHRLRQKRAFKQKMNATLSKCSCDVKTFTKDMFCEKTTPSQRHEAGENTIVTDNTSATGTDTTNDNTTDTKRPVTKRPTDCVVVDQTKHPKSSKLPRRRTVANEGAKIGLLAVKPVPGSKTAASASKSRHAHLSARSAASSQRLKRNLELRQKR